MTTDRLSTMLPPGRIVLSILIAMMAMIVLACTGVARAAELNWSRSAEGHSRAYARALAHPAS